LTANNTSPSWEGPELKGGEVVEARLEARDEERRQRVQRLLSRPLPQRKAETIFLRRRLRL